MFSVAQVFKFLFTFGGLFISGKIGTIGVDSDLDYSSDEFG